MKPLSTVLPVKVHNLVRADYRSVLTLQQNLYDSLVVKSKQITRLQFEAAKNASSSNESAAEAKSKIPPVHDAETPIHIIVCEHAPRGVYTMGKRDTSSDFKQYQQQDNINNDDKEETDPLVRLGRGGGLTYHGPGQLMLYPIVHVPSLQKLCPPGSALAERTRKQGALHYYTALLEETMIATLGEFGVEQAFPGNTGVWVPDSYSPRCGDSSSSSSASSLPVFTPPASRTEAPAGAKKVGFIGLDLRQMCSMHGLCLNVTDECLKFFQRIVICEMHNAETTSIESVLSRAEGKSSSACRLDLHEQVAPVALEKFLTLSGLKK